MPTPSALDVHRSLRDFADTVAAVEAIFRQPREEVEAMIDQLRQVPLPPELVTWESDGGALR